MKKRNLLFPLILVIFPHVALLIYLLYAIDVIEKAHIPFEREHQEIIIYGYKE